MKGNEDELTGCSGELARMLARAGTQAGFL